MATKFHMYLTWYSRCDAGQTDSCTDKQTTHVATKTEGSHTVPLSVLDYI